MKILVKYLVLFWVLLEPGMIAVKKEIPISKIKGIGIIFIRPSSPYISCSEFEGGCLKYPSY